MRVGDGAGEHFDLVRRALGAPQRPLERAEGLQRRPFGIDRRDEERAARFGAVAIHEQADAPQIARDDVALLGREEAEPRAVHPPRLDGGEIRMLHQPSLDRR